MTVAFICDGDNKIGAGHFFRCNAIAEFLRNRSIQTVFFFPSRDLMGFAEKVGVTYRFLPGLFSDVEQAIDSVMIQLEEIQCDRVLVDSHRASMNLLSRVNNRYPTIYIDDLLSYPYPVDVLINSHIDITEQDYGALYAGKSSALPKLMVGGAYFPMKSRMTNKTAGRGINVSFFAGGADPDHVTIRMLNYLMEQHHSLHYNLHIVVGMMNNDYPAIEKICSHLPGIQLHFGLTDLSNIYRQSDLAISAAGITLYELAYYGVPSVAYSMVDNQVHTAEAFDKAGISINIGVSKQLQVFPQMFAAVDKLISDQELRKKMSEDAKMVIDGYGAVRIADCIRQAVKEK